MLKGAVKHTLVYLLQESRQVTGKQNNTLFSKENVKFISEFESHTFALLTRIEAIVGSKGMINVC